MSKKERKTVNYTYGVNLTQLGLCLILYALRVWGLFANPIIMCAANVIEVLIWFAFGLVFALGMSAQKAGTVILYSLMSILPISLITAVMSALGNVGAAAHEISWAKFFFIGSAVDFFNKPGVFLALYLPKNAYIAYWANIALLFLFSFIGGLFGVGANKSAKRKKAAESKARKKAAEQKKAKADDKNAAASRQRDEDKPIAQTPKSEEKTASDDDFSASKAQESKSLEKTAHERSDPKREKREKRKREKERRENEKLQKALERQQKKDKLNPIKMEKDPDFVPSPDVEKIQQEQSAKLLAKEAAEQFGESAGDEVFEQASFFDFEKIDLSDNKDDVV